MSVEKTRERKRAQNAAKIGGLLAVAAVISAFFGLWLFTGWAWNVWTWLQMLALALAFGLVVYGFIRALLGGGGSSTGQSRDKPHDKD